ncbi:MAG: hypothetical protein SGJ13_17805 [Actinomycetota bacterium]|nr:hypothetical protein [Actinomycetota bacterium]
MSEWSDQLRDKVTAPDVVFDFEGSLAQARRLWRLADELEQYGVTRYRGVESILESWQGRYASVFAPRIYTEGQNLMAIVELLREEARLWSAAWEGARSEQNLRLRARAVFDEKASRSTGEGLWDDITGSEDSDREVGPPPRLTRPQPPDFVDVNPVYRP